MDVVVDQIVAVLEVLAFGNAVRGDQDVDLVVVVREEKRLFLGKRGEEREDGVEVHLELRNRGTPVLRAGDHGRVQAELFLRERRDVLVEVGGRVGERGEDQDFPVAGIDRILDLLLNLRHQVIELGIVFRRDVRDHGDQQVERVDVFPQMHPPIGPAHIGKGDFDLASNGENVVGDFLVIVLLCGIDGIGEFEKIHVADFLETVDCGDGSFDQSLDPLQCEVKRINGTFQTLQEADAHQATDSKFASDLHVAAAAVLRAHSVFPPCTGEDEQGRHVDQQIQRLQRFEDFLVVDRIRKRGERGAETQRRKTQGELPDLGGIVILFNVLARTGDCNGVKQLEKVEIKAGKQLLSGPFLGGQIAPVVEDLLRRTENLLDGVAEFHIGFELPRIALVGQLQLVFQVSEAVVHRSGREHQHLRLYTGLDDVLHQALVAVFDLIDMRAFAIAEIVGFVDHHEVVGIPAQPGKIDAVRFALVSGEIAVIKHIVVQAVFGDGIIQIVSLERVPVVGELLRAEHEDVFVALLIILDDAQRGEGLAEANTVRKDATIVRFELVDDGQDRILLEIVE